MFTLNAQDVRMIQIGTSCEYVNHPPGPHVHIPAIITSKKQIRTLLFSQVLSCLDYARFCSLADLIVQTLLVSYQWFSLGTEKGLQKLHL